jgi:enoyl-CoA hydratase/carnithine racemase
VLAPHIAPPLPLPSLLVPSTACLWVPCSHLAHTLQHPATQTPHSLFPDVGGSHFLSRLPGEVGTYFGLTGQRLTPADMLYCGLATHFIPSEALPELRSALSTLPSPNDLEPTLTRLGGAAAAAASEDSQLERFRSKIDETFRFDSLEEICASLEAAASKAGESDDFASKTLATLRRMSPTSCKITLRLMREARKEAHANVEAPLTRVLEREFRVVQRCVTPPSDFFEGIRAALVDKDRKPVWSPASFEEVSDAAVDEFFAELGNRELKVPQLPGFSEA